MWPSYQQPYGHTNNNTHQNIRHESSVGGGNQSIFINTVPNQQPTYFQAGQNHLNQHPTDFSQLIPQPLPPPAPIVVVVANGQMDQLEVAVNQNGNDTKVTINSNPSITTAVNNVDQYNRNGGYGLSTSSGSMETYQMGNGKNRNQWDPSFVNYRTSTSMQMAFRDGKLSAQGNTESQEIKDGVKVEVKDEPVDGGVADIKVEHNDEIKTEVKEEIKEETETTPLAPSYTMMGQRIPPSSMPPSVNSVIVQRSGSSLVDFINRKLQRKKEIALAQKNATNLGQQQPSMAQPNRLPTPEGGMTTIKLGNSVLTLPSAQLPATISKILRPVPVFSGVPAPSRKVWQPLPNSTGGTMVNPTRQVHVKMGGDVEEGVDSKLKWGTIIPLIGGSSIGCYRSAGNLPTFHLSYTPFKANDSHIYRYWPQVPKLYIDENPNIKFEGQVDFVNSVCPCAGLSMLNTSTSGSSGRGSDAEKNQWMFKSAGYVLENIKPKVLWGENAQGLFTTLGEGVLSKLREIGRNNGYSFSIIKTNTELHGIPQRRIRSFYFFWNTPTAPMLNWKRRNSKTLKEYLKEIPKDAPLQDMFLSEGKVSERFRPYQFCLEREGLSHEEFCIKYKKTTISQFLDDNGLIDECIEWLKKGYPTEGFNYKNAAGKAGRTHIGYLRHMQRKKAMGKGYWDDSPRFHDKVFHAVMSKTMTYSVHPSENRFLNVREMMHLMGLPHDFTITDTRQINHIAQNVPVATVKDWADEVKKFCKGQLPLTEYSFIKQDNIHQDVLYTEYGPIPPKKSSEYNKENHNLMKNTNGNEKSTQGNETNNNKSNVVINVSNTNSSGKTITTSSEESNIKNGDSILSSYESSYDAKQKKVKSNNNHELLPRPPSRRKAAADSRNAISAVATDEMLGSDDFDYLSSSPEKDITMNKTFNELQNYLAHLKKTQIT